MNKPSKILLVLAFVLSLFTINAQNESPLLPLFNPLMLNPAFAGIDKVSAFKTGNQLVVTDSAASYNLFYATYDTYSDKLKGGIAFYFSQGLISNRNIGTTELGFAYSAIPRQTKNGSIRLGLNANFLLATKQWSVYFLDRIMIDEQSEPNLPGEELFRYAMIKPRVSLLWDLPDFVWGFSLGSALKTNFAESEISDNKMPLNASFYLAKNRQGYRNGLHSLPFVINPEILAYYSEDFILGRLNLYAEFTKKTLGVFTQGDFSHEIYSIGGIAGLASGNLRLNLAAGAAFAAQSKKIGFTGELSLIVKVPQFDYSKINPWQPQ